MWAMENLLPEDKRLFEDPYSEKLLPPFWKFWVILTRPSKILNFLIKMRGKSSPGMIGGIICRTRYIDDFERLATQFYIALIAA